MLSLRTELFYLYSEYMNKKSLLILFILLVTVVVPVYAQRSSANPSVYSYAEIVKKLPEMWTANPIEVMEMLGSYPDYVCSRSGDLIACDSVNNRYADDIQVSFQFSSEDDYSEFVQSVFTMEIHDNEAVQNILEAFWLEGMKSANMLGAPIPAGQVCLLFSTENTLMTVTVPMTEDGKVWNLTVSFGVIRG